MVFLTFPKELTAEEKMLQQKYAILQRKKKQLAELKGPKVESSPAPIPIVKKSMNEGPKADPKEVAKKLLKSGAIAAIKPPPSNATTGFKRKRNTDRPTGYKHFSSTISEDQQPSPSNPPPPSGDRYKELYSNFVLGKEEDMDNEGRKHRSRYVNRDNPYQGITVFVKGIGLSENLLKLPLSNYGSILNLVVEEEKNCAFVTFETIDEANRSIDEMNNRTIDGVKIQVSLAKRQFHLPSSKGSASSSSGSEPPATSTSGANVTSWSMIAANFSAGSAPTGNKSAPAGNKSAPGVKKDGNKATRELIVYEDDIPDD